MNAITCDQQSGSAGINTARNSVNNHNIRSYHFVSICRFQNELSTLTVISHLSVAFICIQVYETDMGTIKELMQCDVTGT